MVIDTMTILIDGYNLIKSVEKVSMVSSEQIDRSLRELGRYAKKTANTVIIVFDGGPDLYQATDKIYGITVVHSGARMSADDSIKNYLSVNKSKDIILVSTDRELDAYAVSLGIEYVDSAHFYALMKERLLPDLADRVLGDDFVHKTSRRTSPELDILMEQASEEVLLKRDDRLLQSRARKGKKMAKKERKKLHLLKKI